MLYSGLNWNENNPIKETLNALDNTNPGYISNNTSFRLFNNPQPDPIPNDLVPNLNYSLNSFKL